MEVGLVAGGLAEAGPDGAEDGIDIGVGEDAGCGDVVAGAAAGLDDGAGCCVIGRDGIGAVGCDMGSGAGAAAWVLPRGFDWFAGYRGEPLYGSGFGSVLFGRPM
jgi:hypothetical protein